MRSINAFSIIGLVLAVSSVAVSSGQRDKSSSVILDFPVPFEGMEEIGQAIQNREPGASVFFLRLRLANNEKYISVLALKVGELLRYFRGAVIANKSEEEMSEGLINKTGLQPQVLQQIIASTAEALKIHVKIEQMNDDELDFTKWQATAETRSNEALAEGIDQSVIVTAKIPHHAFVKTALTNDNGWHLTAQSDKNQLLSALGGEVVSKLHQLIETCNCSQWINATDCHFYQKWTPDGCRMESRNLKSACKRIEKCSKFDFSDPKYEKYCQTGERIRNCSDVKQCFDACKTLEPTKSACNATCEQPEGLRKIDKLFQGFFYCCEVALRGSENESYPIWEACTVDKDECPEGAGEDKTGLYVGVGVSLIVLALVIVIGVSLAIYFGYIKPRKERLEKMQSDEPKK